MDLPKRAFIRRILNEIVKRVDADDLVITADIPLAVEVIEKGALALNPRGELYTSEDIRHG